MPAKVPKPDADLMSRVERALAAVPARPRKMFGTTSWFLDANDQMFTGLWGDALTARVGVEGAERLIGAGKADAFEPMAGRPMREYVLVSGAQLSRDRDVRTWVDRAARFAAALPAKKK
jgi:hypothetical protein